MEYAIRSELRETLVKQIESKYKSETVKSLYDDGFKYLYRGTKCEIDRQLKQRLDEDLKAIVNAWDCVFVVTGMEGCLTGDTEIICNRAGNSRKYKLDYMFRQYQKKEKKGWNLDIPTMVRSYNGNHIKLHKIKNVVFSGEKEVYLLELENNRNIKATADHKILTKRGWIELKKLTKEDVVMCDPESPTKKIRKTIKKYDVALRVPYHPYKNNSGRVEIHRLCYEANLNNIHINIYLDKLLNEVNCVNELKFVNPNTHHIHHKDGNHYNNSVENLQLMTKEDHLKKHGEYNYCNFNQSIPFYSKVKNISHIGIRKTYDIQCEHPHHNFNANGIIVHNSGKSMGAGMTLATYFSWIFNSDFTVDNVVFTPKQFEERVDQAKKYEVIFWDEFIFGGSADQTMSKMQKSLKKTFTVIRHKRLFIILLMPYFHMMNKYWALARSRALINVVSPDGVRRGYGRFYGYQKKRFAYIHGKKNMDIMPFKYDFEVKFLDFANKDVVGKPPIDLEAYELKKTLSRKEADKDEEENSRSKKAEKFKKRIKILANFMIENKIATMTEIAKMFKIAPSTFSEFLKSEENQDF